MNLKPELLATLTALGLDASEVETFKARMAEAVTSIEARLTAINAQMSTLAGLRAEIMDELDQAQLTVAKLADF